VETKKSHFREMIFGCDEVKTEHYRSILPSKCKCTQFCRKLKIFLQLLLQDSITCMFFITKINLNQNLTVKKMFFWAY